MNPPLSPERARQIQHLFDDAVELAPDAREAFLERACGDDSELFHEVASLLPTSAPTPTGSTSP